MSYDGSELDDLGIPSALVDQRARQVFQSELNQIQQYGQAIAAANLKHADFGNYSAQVGRELDTNPQLRAYAAQDPAGAMELAYQAVKRQGPQRGYQSSTPMGGAPSVPESSFRNVYADRSVLSVDEEHQRGFGPDGRPKDEASAMRYAKARLREVISDDFLNS